LKIIPNARTTTSDQDLRIPSKGGICRRCIGLCFAFLSACQYSGGFQLIEEFFKNEFHLSSCQCQICNIYLIGLVAVGTKAKKKKDLNIATEIVFLWYWDC
jgi:uncharacterized ferredoxin-like protein